MPAYIPASDIKSINSQSRIQFRVESGVESTYQVSSLQPKRIDFLLLRQCYGHYIEGSAPQYLNSIFDKNEIFVSKWSWQHQLFQYNKILTPTRTVFTQYTNVWSLPGNLPCCTALIVLGNNILTPDLRLCGHRVYMDSAGGLFCFQSKKKS